MAALPAPTPSQLALLQKKAALKLPGEKEAKDGKDKAKARGVSVQVKRHSGGPAERERFAWLTLCCLQGKPAAAPVLTAKELEKVLGPKPAYPKELDLSGTSDIGKRETETGRGSRRETYRAVFKFFFRVWLRRGELPLSSHFYCGAPAQVVSLSLNVPKSGASAAAVSRFFYMCLSFLVQLVPPFTVG
jgi:hypothetical protein